MALPRGGGHRFVGRCCADTVRGDGVTIERGPHDLRPPDPEKDGERSHGKQRRDDVHKPWPMEIGDEKLRYREAHSGDEDGRPNLQRAAPAGERYYKPERHDHREKRQLPADHRTQIQQRQPRHGRKCKDRGAERPIRDRRGVRYQGQPRGGERREAESNQDRAGHGHRRPETSGSFEKRTEAERDQEQLKAPVFGDSRDAVLQDLEQAQTFGEPVEENDVEDDPADRQEAERGAKQGSFACHGGRHAENEHGTSKRDRECQQRRNMRLHAKYAERTEQNDHRKRGDDRREPCVVERIIDLRPDHRCLPCARQILRPRRRHRRMSDDRRSGRRQSKLTSQYTFRHGKKTRWQGLRKRRGGASSTRPTPSSIEGGLHASVWTKLPKPPELPSGASIIISTARTSCLPPCSRHITSWPWPESRNGPSAGPATWMPCSIRCSPILYAGLQGRGLPVPGSRASSWSLPICRGIRREPLRAAIRPRSRPGSRMKLRTRRSQRRRMLHVRCCSSSRAQHR